MKAILTNPWVLLAVLLIALSIWGHGFSTGKSVADARHLAAENKVKENLLTVRNKQNEIRNARPDLDAAVKRLRNGKFNPQGRAR